MKLVKEVDLASLKSDIGKLDIDKLKIDPVDLYKLSNAVENDVKKLYIMNRFKKVNAIQTNDTSNLVKNTDYNTKIKKI